MEGGGFKEIRGLEWVARIEEGCLENHGGIEEVGWYRGFW